MFYDIICKSCDNVFEIKTTIKDFENNFYKGKQKKDSKIKCSNCKKYGNLETVIQPTYFPRFWKEC